MLSKASLPNYRTSFVLSFSVIVPIFISIFGAPVSNTQLLNHLTEKELLHRQLLQWHDLPTYFLQFAHILP